MISYSKLKTIIIFHILFLFAAQAFAQLPVVSNFLPAPNSDRNIHIFIVAPSAFKDSYWTKLSESGLDASIQNSGSKLKAFFESKKYVKSVEFLDEFQETSKGAIRKKWLEKSLEIGTKPSMIMFFFIGHGLVKTEDNLQQHLFITSDSNKNPTEDNAINISRFINRVNQDLKNSYVLTFLDTCYSGAVSDSFSLIQNDLSLDRYGLFNYLITSSAPHRKSYGAHFTKTLLKMWEEGNEDERCTDLFGDEMLDSLEEKFQQVLKEENIYDDEYKNSFSPQRHIANSDSDKICLETFRGHRSCFVLYNSLPVDVEFEIFVVENKVKRRIRRKFIVKSKRRKRFFPDLNKEYLIVSYPFSIDYKGQEFLINPSSDGNSLGKVILGDKSNDIEYLKSVNTDLLEISKFLEIDNLSKIKVELENDLVLQNEFAVRGLQPAVLNSKTNWVGTDLKDIIEFDQESDNLLVRYKTENSISKRENFYDLIVQLMVESKTAEAEKLANLAYQYTGDTDILDLNKDIIYINKSVDALNYNANFKINSNSDNVDLFDSIDSNYWYMGTGVENTDMLDATSPIEKYEEVRAYHISSFVKKVAPKLKIAF
ncbi:hypothetical protein [Maribacter stanieri]|uniref:hypothetical protein n=1 Tax=Maribacter stanieri TaxID=440514 RepID=UPI00249402BD|nr:hypothetical protein [Maribacter stanieri]